MTTYPKRDSHFAHEYVRRMVKVCLANQLGQEVFTLLSIIAHTEDAAHYRRAVNWWNEQLMVVAGFTNVKAMERARAKAVKAGWLHYERGARSKPPCYWCTIPSEAEGLDDAPTDEGDCRQSVVNPGDNVSSICRQSVVGPSSECRTSIPIPIPNQKGEDAPAPPFRLKTPLKFTDQNIPPEKLAKWRGLMDDYVQHRRDAQGCNPLSKIESDYILRDFEIEGIDAAIRRLEYVLEPGKGRWSLKTIAEIEAEQKRKSDPKKGPAAKTGRHVYDKTSAVTNRILEAYTNLKTRVQDERNQETQPGRPIFDAPANSGRPAYQALGDERGRDTGPDADDTDGSRIHG